MLLVESLLGSSSAATNPYVEDVFSTYLYTGTGAAQSIPAGIQLGNGATTSGWFSTSDLTPYASRLKWLKSITTDTTGNVYVAGALPFSDSYTNAYVAKLNAAGAVQWHRTIGESGSNVANGVAIDSSGNVYTCGSVAAIATGGNALIAKYNSSGTLQWQRKLGTTNSEVANGVAVDSSGNVYICGKTYTSATADYNFFVAKYNTSGTLQWQRKIVSATAGNTMEANSIAVDSSGNVYATGYETVSAGTNNIITVKYNTSGTIQWQRRLSSSRTCTGFGIGLDSTGSNVYVTGSLNVTGRGDDVVLIKYNTSGTLQWQRTAYGASTTSDVGYSLTLDSSDNIYVSITSNSSANTAGVLKYNSSGSLQFQKSISASGNQSIVFYGIATNSTDSIYLSGYRDGSSTYPGIIAKLAIDGTGNGAYGVYTYASSSLTDAAGALTDAASTLTASAASMTSSTGTATDSAASQYYTINNIPTGTGYGGMVWMKGRSGATDHALYDTARGATFDLASNLTTAQTTQSTGLTSFDGAGFSIGAFAKLNTNAATYASWTFRKQAKFFDVVTYTGNGANRTIAHNLGSVPGSIFVKRTDTTGAWAVYHRSLANTEYMVLNTTAAKATGATYWNSTTPTSSVFSLGTSTDVNASGATYVAYLFAHDAGGFGATGSDNVISCGSYTGNGSTTGPTITLGYEPQFLLVKQTNAAGTAWRIQDNMRSLNATGTANLFPNYDFAESASPTVRSITPTATGFFVNPSSSIDDYNASGGTYIYIAIRRGPMKTPTTGTSVYNAIVRSGTAANATISGVGFSPDLAVVKGKTSGDQVAWNDRLRGTLLELMSSNTNSEISTTDTILSFTMDGASLGADATRFDYNATGHTYANWFLRRAPGFFDVVCYTGTGSATTQSHNLGVAPELMIVKNRSTAQNWVVYSASLGNTNYVLFTSAATVSGSTIWNSTNPTSSVFSIGTSAGVNGSGNNLVAYLFATVVGVSKVGSYTGTGTTKQIDCGFTGGARFVLIKRTDSTGDWYVWDSARGIVAGNDPYLLLNSTAAEVTSTDYVDTYSAGFELSSTAPAALNASGGTYIFLAIA